MAALSIAPAWCAAWSPPDTRPIYDWAGDHVFLSSPLTRTGLFSIVGSRHLIGPFDGLHSDYVREVNVMAPVRGAKTLIADIWLPHLVKRDPGAFRGVFQNDQVAKEHCETRTRKILERCAAIADLMALVPRHGNRTQEILFPHMPVYIQGPALGTLQSKGFRYMWLDEPWLYPPGTIDEAKGRLGDFLKMGTSKLLCTSQGGNAGDEWDVQFRSGELNLWHVQCASCGVYHSAEFSGERDDGERVGIVWDTFKDKSGDWEIEKCKETVRYECPHCRHPHIDTARTKAEWDRTGKYVVVGDPKRDKKSFRWTSVIDYPWRELVDLYLSARNQAHLGNERPTIVFCQKRIPENFDPKRLSNLSTVPTVEFASEPGKPIVYEGISFTHRFMAVDVQALSFWVVIMAWSARSDDLVLWAGEVFTWADVEAKQKEHEVPDEDVEVDMGHRGHEVIVECAKHGHWEKDKAGRQHWLCWKALRGADDFSFVYNDNGKKIQLPYSWPPQMGDPLQGYSPTDPRFAALKGKRCMVIRWSNSWVKDVVMQRWNGKATGIKSLTRKGPWNKDYAFQMNSQKKVFHKPKFSSGGWRYVQKWSDYPDHLLDCRCMCTVRAMMKKLILPEMPQADAAT